MPVSSFLAGCWWPTFSSHKHGHFSWETAPEFYAAYGFLCYLLLIALAKILRRFIKRPRTTMISGLPPALLFLVGAALVPLLPQRYKQAFMLALPLFALYLLYNTPLGTYWSFSFLDYQIVLMKLDRLSRVFAYIFLIISVIGFLFALKVEDDLQHSAALSTRAGPWGSPWCGDWFSLYVYWEFMAVASTFLILARRTPAARAAALRYILVHLFGGLLLFAGIMLCWAGRGSIAIGALKLDSAASWLIFLGIALNAAIPPLHPWLKDAYPEATPTGAVFLSAFTTKSAVYLMCRTFAGAEVLIWVGAIMTIFPIFYAVLENDIRRVLSYSLMNQVGYMMCGIGIGTTLAINGTVSHAFCHILYKALLFMAAGSVLTMTGRSRCTDLGGLYKTMPLTAVFCMVGSASISAFPLFSGFVSKSMIVSAAGPAAPDHHLVHAPVRLGGGHRPRGHQGALLHLLWPRLRGQGQRSALEHDLGHGHRRLLLPGHRHFPPAAV